MIKYYRLQIQTFLKMSHQWDKMEKILRKNPSPEAKAEMAKIGGYKDALKMGLGFLTSREREIVTAEKYSSDIDKMMRTVAERLEEPRRRLYTEREKIIEPRLRKELESHCSFQQIGAFYDFELDSFLKDSLTWDNEIETLTLKRLSLFGLKSIVSDPTGISSTLISDTTGQTVARITEIEGQISRLYLYKDAYRNLIYSLTAEEFDILNVYHMEMNEIGRKSDIMYLIKNKTTRKDAFCNKHYCSEGTLSRKNQALTARIRKEFVNKYIRPYLVEDIAI